MIVDLYLLQFAYDHIGDVLIEYVLAVAEDVASEHRQRKITETSRFVDELPVHKMSGARVPVDSVRLSRRQVELSDAFLRRIADAYVQLAVTEKEEIRLY